MLSADRHAVNSLRNGRLCRRGTWPGEPHAGL